MLNPAPVPHNQRDANGLLSIGNRVAQFAVNCLFTSLGSMPLDYFTFSERDFHAELYHQCRKRFSPRAINRQFPNELAVQHPITLTSESGKTTGAARDNYNIAMDWKIPDLLFHNPVGLESQWCAVELKRRNISTNEDSIRKDIKNLLFYVSGRLNFYHAVFILNNMPRNPLIMAHNFAPGNIFTTGDLLTLLDEEIQNVEDARPEYLELWVINPPAAAQNDQDPLFFLERSICNSNRPGDLWQRLRYVRRGNRLGLIR